MASLSCLVVAVKGMRQGLLLTTTARTPGQLEAARRVVERFVRGRDHA